jgi:hypothetical protein
MLIYFGTKVDLADLPWDTLVEYILVNVDKRFFSLIHLVHAGAEDCDMIVNYCSMVRLVLECSCLVLSKMLEGVQKRFLKLLCAAVDYSTALQNANLDRLD